MKYKTLPLENFEHRYTISNKGKVYDLQNKKFLRPRLSRKEGRERPVFIVALYTKDGKRTTIRLANAVANHFCDNPNGHINIYHKDRNIQNNNAWNLVWLAPDVHYYAVQLNRGKIKRKALVGCVAKEFERQDAIKAIQNLKKHNKEEIVLLNYYQTNNEKHLWDIYKALAPKLFTRAKQRVKEDDAYDVMMESWLYFVDCCKRNTVQNYVFKTWLTHFEFKAKDYWKLNANLIYTDVHFEDITPRHPAVLPNELSEEINYY